MRPLSWAIAGSGTRGGIAEVGAAATTVLRHELVAKTRRHSFEFCAQLGVKLDVVGLCIQGNLCHHCLRSADPALYCLEARENFREDDGVVVDRVVHTRDEDLIAGEASMELCNI